MKDPIEQQKLGKLLKAAKDAYYNTGKFYKATKAEVPETLQEAFFGAGTKGVITDQLYDWLEELYKAGSKKKLDTGAPIQNKKARVPVPFPMPSLDKANPESLSRWLSKNPGPYCASDKIDGVSIGIEEDQEGTFAATRGDGVTGGDISFMADALRIPVMPVGTKVRGEIVMHGKDFTKYAADFANPRNMVSGITNRNSIHPALKSCIVYAYELIKPRLAPSKAFAKLKSLGFKVPNYEVFPDGTTAEEFVQYYHKRKKSAGYDIDGLVIVQDKVNSVASSNPKWAIALKDFDINPMGETTVIDVQWNVGRTGILFPRILLKPIKLGGVTVSYCSGKSADLIKRRNIGPGTILQIARSGDVIPDIRKVVKATEAALPSKEEFPGWMWKGAHIVLPKQSMESHSVVKIKRIANFFVHLGIKNFKAATIQKFMAAGFTDLDAIINMSREEFLSVPGTSPKVLAPVYDKMDDLCADLPQTTAMLASGCFAGSVGVSMTAKLAKYPCVTMPAAQLKQALYDDPDLTDREYKLLLDGLKTFRAWLKGVNITVNDKPAKPKKQINGVLTGKKFVFTGVRNSTVEQAITSLGGKIGGDVTPDTTLLIVKDLGSTSIKMSKAKQYGVRVISIDKACETDWAKFK